MNRLLVQSCSASKRSVDEEVPAIDLYDGYFYRIIDKARRTNSFDSSFDIVILSARYGLLEGDALIEPYDRRMDRDRAQELNDTVVPELADLVDGGDYDEVWINGGREYRMALDGIESAVDAPVRYVEGGGIGEMGHQLKELITI
jgi:hypothetical protein